MTRFITSVLGVIGVTLALFIGKSVTEPKPAAARAEIVGKGASTSAPRRLMLPPPKRFNASQPVVPANNAASGIDLKNPKFPAPRVHPWDQSDPLAYLSPSLGLTVASLSPEEYVIFRQARFNYSFMMGPDDGFPDSYKLKQLHYYDEGHLDQIGKDRQTEREYGVDPELKAYEAQLRKRAEKLKSGMTRPEVVALLGEPVVKHYNEVSYIYSPRAEYRYRLPGDTFWTLCTGFDEQGKLTTWQWHAPQLLTPHVAKMFGVATKPE